MRTLHFDCSSGISGDMAVAAMLDLGVDRGALLEALATLPVDGFEAAVSEVERSGLRALDFSVALERDNLDHDPGHLYGSKEAPHGPGRSYPEVRAVIEGSGLGPEAKGVSLRILEILAEAEAEAHGVPVGEVHFHEIGALDTIADIAALGFCVDALGFGRVSFSDLYEGGGTVRCQHGVIPVPVPAVVNIARSHGLTLRPTGAQGELVTPTGAAFAAAVRTADPPESFRIERVGVGAGKRETGRAGVLRAMVLDDAGSDRVLKLECNVDDCTGEALSHAVSLLMEAGARDAFIAPVLMKKGRPGWLLTVVCDPGDRAAMEGILFRETSTIGVRRTEMDRTVLDRRIVEVDVGGERVRVKVSEGGGALRVHPEDADVDRVARRTGASYEDVRREAESSCRRTLRAGVRSSEIHEGDDEHGRDDDYPRD